MATLQTLNKIHRELNQFTTGVGELCLDLEEQGLTGAVLGSVFAQCGPRFNTQSVRDGRQALTVVLKRDDRYLQINLVTLLVLARAGTDMPEELEPQWGRLMSVTISENWKPQDFHAYVIGDHLDATKGTELSALSGERQAYVVILSRKGSATIILNLASLLAMARFADVPEPVLTCEELRNAAIG